MFAICWVIKSYSKKFRNHCDIYRYIQMPRVVIILGYSCLSDSDMRICKFNKIGLPCFSCRRKISYHQKDLKIRAIALGEDSSANKQSITSEIMTSRAWPHSWKLHVRLWSQKMMTSSRYQNKKAYSIWGRQNQRPYTVWRNNLLCLPDVQAYSYRHFLIKIHVINRLR